jgi:hypothetical protein
MGYGDNRNGDDRWQGRGEGGGRWERERSSYGDWGSDRERGGSNHGSGNEDRGFFERAADQARSWFSDDDDRGRQRMGGGQGSDGGRGGASFGGGFGNQRGWSDQHYDRQYGPEQGRGRDRDESYAGGGGNRSSWGGGGGGPELFGGSGFGGPEDNGRRFDRIDPGHVGAQGAHPMSAPVDSGYGAGAGISPGGGAGSSAARYAAMGGGVGERHIDKARLLGEDRGGSRQGFGGTHHDPHYSEWRQRQIEQLDREYEEYRREHQSRFEQDFGGWREKRQTQRQHLRRATEHMEVLGSDGQHIGTVDKISGDRIILTKSDPNAGGIHHSIPCSWIESVDERVTVNKTAEQAMQAWQSEEQNRALFERGDEGSEGPHMLNRSFSNTYTDRDD